VCEVTKIDASAIYYNATLYFNATLTDIKYLSYTILIEHPFNYYIKEDVYSVPDFYIFKPNSATW
jgi:predicted metal-dependent phosphoesterase TrpH